MPYLRRKHTLVKYTWWSLTYQLNKFMVLLDARKNLIYLFVENS